MKARIAATLSMSVILGISFLNPVTLADSELANPSVSLYESYTADSIADVLYSIHWKAQTFTPSITHTITTVNLKLSKVGNPSGDVIVSIRATDTNGLPTGDDLATGILSCTSIQENQYAWYEFKLGAGCTLMSGTKYAIIMRVTNSDEYNKIYFRINTSGAYPNGWLVGSNNSGTSWGDMANKTWDAVFEEWGTGETPTDITIFVTPAITDMKILPNSALPVSYISNQISLAGCPGEYRPATFTIYSPENVSDITLSVTDLTSPNNNPISSLMVDIRSVKCWYQDSGGLLSPTGIQTLVPELLLKDDSLIRIDNGENYLKMTDGEYRWISNPSNRTGYTKPTTSEFPVQDSDTLQPVDIPAETNKQFWITVRIPNDTQPGMYTGTIELISSSGNIAEIQLTLEVLPFNLAPSMLEYSLYYMGGPSVVFPNGTISHRYKSEEQLRAEFRNMIEHGLDNIVFGCGWDRQNPTNWDFLGTLLDIRNEVGMTNRPLYYAWLQTGNPSDPAQLETLKQNVQSVIDFTQTRGVTDVYAYGLDEIYDPDLVLTYRPAWQAVYEAGGKVFIAGEGSRTPYIDVVGDLVSILNNCYADINEPAKWHDAGKKIFCYNNPQVGEERPATYRLNFGLLLWQRDYDGAMNFAYQSGVGDIWNDFDSVEYRDHLFAYPTVNGVVDTVQWEGWREGVNDIRYLSTLIEAIEQGKADGTDTYTAEAWLDELKTSNLTTGNLDTIRSEMIDLILSLGSFDQPSNSDDDVTTNQTEEDWDVNGDGVANVLDMILIGQRWGETGLSGWIKADTNKDGTINVLDMIIIGQHWT